MSQFLFKNKWVVLAFVVLVLVGMQALVGRNGVLSSAPHEVEDTGDRPQEAGSPVPDVVVVPATAEPDDEDSSADDGSQSFVDDNDLIDQADGYDPTPPDDQQADDNGGSNDDNGEPAPDGGDE